MSVNANTQLVLCLQQGFTFPHIISLYWRGNEDNFIFLVTIKVESYKSAAVILPVEQLSTMNAHEYMWVNSLSVSLGKTKVSEYDEWINYKCKKNSNISHFSCRNRNTWHWPFTKHKLGQSPAHISPYPILSDRPHFKCIYFKSLQLYLDITITMVNVSKYTCNKWIWEWNYSQKADSNCWNFSVINVPQQINSSCLYRTF